METDMADLPESSCNESACETSATTATCDVVTQNISDIGSTSNAQPVSKRQLKRLLKAQNWLENLPAKRAKERKKSKQRRAEARRNNVLLGPTRKQLKEAKMSSSNCKLRLVLDFSFDDLMDQRTMAKCVKQVQRCYCCNRRLVNPVQFHIVNLNGKSREEMNKLTGYENWDVFMHSTSYEEMFPKEQLIYLTSESENVIESLDHDKIYIIGALVDHNLHKGLCYNRAKESGIQHGRLPISEYLDMKSRKVLTINHVFEIVANVANNKSWKEAMLSVLPQRKGAVAKNKPCDD